MLSLTVFKEKVLFNTNIIILRCFMKEIIPSNVLFIMYWMLTLSCRISPANVALPFKYLT